MKTYDHVILQCTKQPLSNLSCFQLGIKYEFIERDITVTGV